MKDLTRALGRAADGAFITDQNQRVLYWNRSAEELLGHASIDAIGRSCHHILEGCDQNDQLICHKHCRIAASALAGEFVSDYDLCVRTAAGGKRWINISTFTFPRNGTGVCPLLVHLFRDATAKVQNERFIEQMLDAATHLQRKGLVAPAPSPAGPATELTDREHQVLSLLADGLGTREMAAVLSISPSTVRNHIRNILSKFQVHSRLEAVVYALQNGLVVQSGQRRECEGL
jgi:PAS domain S-box-containing protein